MVWDRSPTQVRDCGTNPFITAPHHDVGNGNELKSSLPSSSSSSFSLGGQSRAGASCSGLQSLNPNVRVEELTVPLTKEIIAKFGAGNQETMIIVK